MKGVLIMNEGIAFEKMCETLFRKRGYLIKKRGSRSYDGGIDIIMRHENSDDIIAVRCKNTKKPVGRPDVQKLYGAIENHNYTDINFNRGFVVSASGFSEDAVQWVNNLNYKKDRNILRLITFEEL